MGVRNGLTEKKRLAIERRKSGDSYSVIVEHLKLSKSTLSGWLKGIPYTPNEETLMRIKNGPRKSAEIRHLKKLSSIEQVRSLANSEIGKTQVDMRLNKSTYHHNKLPYGTVQIRVRAGKNEKLGVFLHRRIMGWIEAIIQQVNTMRD